MTPGVLVFGLGGLLTSCGLVALVAALRARNIDQPAWRSSRQSRLGQLRLRRGHLVAAGAGLAVFAITGWPVAAAGVGLGVWFVPSVLGGKKAAERDITRTEAIGQWTRRLAELLRSGAAGSLDAALRRSLPACPTAIAGEVAALVSRMGPQGIETALRTFCAEVDNRAAEKVAGALILRSRHGGAGLAEVLSGLADDLDERVRMVREIEAERAKPRSDTRTIVIATALLILAEIVFARRFLSPYATLPGELAMLVVVGIFAVALRWLRRMAQPTRRPTVLSDPPSAGVSR